MTRLTGPQRQVLAALLEGRRLVGAIRWRTGGKRNWRLWTVRPTLTRLAKSSEVWRIDRSLSEAQVKALLRRGWVVAVKTKRISHRELVLTEEGRRVAHWAVQS